LYCWRRPSRVETYEYLL